MKKKITTLLTILSLSSFAYADGIYGVIVDINDGAKTILVDTTYGQKINMKILPNTEIDMDDCGIFGMDKQGTFKDLKVGTFIEAEIFKGYAQTTPNPQTPEQTQNITVKEIKIDCKKRAY
ncbi:hypothetical protein [Campylobacter armoricus]|uniref:DUF5666 domain-containing protein n=1 Tax=Campylobacter armoricus TaxID=2505970 RepID=A0A7L5I8Q3_9BACT|nr:hypothetical protein [Campylobacter armoricus]QKF80410.1 hypothetical protein CARM_1530 [Campylobacter armoricus]